MFKLLRLYLDFTQRLLEEFLLSLMIIFWSLFFFICFIDIFIDFFDWCILYLEYYYSIKPFNKDLYFILLDILYVASDFCDKVDFACKFQLGKTFILYHFHSHYFILYLKLMISESTKLSIHFLVMLTMAACETTSQDFLRYIEKNIFLKKNIHSKIKILLRFLIRLFVYLSVFLFLFIILFLCYFSSFRNISVFLIIIIILFSSHCE